MNFKKLFTTSVNWVSKNSPLILTTLGIGGLGATAYLTYKASDDIEAIVAGVEEANDNNEPLDRAAIIRDLAGALALPAAVGIASAAALVASYKIQSNRVTVLSGALTAVANEYTRYQKKYGQEHGEKKANEFFNTNKKEIEVEGKDGKKKVKQVATADKLHSMTGQWYSASTNYIHDDHDYNMMACDAAIRALEIKVFQKGHLTMNELFEEFGLEETRQGALLGWSDAEFYVAATDGYNVYNDEYEAKVKDIHLSWPVPTYVFK